MFVTTKRGKINVYYFIYFLFLSAAVPRVSSKGRLIASVPRKLRPEVSSFQFSLFNVYVCSVGWDTRIRWIDRGRPPELDKVKEIGQFTSGFLIFFFFQCSEWATKRDYILKSWLHPSAVNVCYSGQGGTHVYSFLSFHFLSAIVPSVLSKDRQSASRPWKLRPTGLEVNSFKCSLFTRNGLPIPQEGSLERATHYGGPMGKSRR